MNEGFSESKYEQGAAEGAKVGRYEKSTGAQRRTQPESIEDLDEELEGWWDGYNKNRD